MDAIKELFKTDISSIILGLFVIMSGIIAMYTIIGKFSEIIKKPVFWVNQKNKDHQLLESISGRLSDLESKHNDDIEEIKKYNNKLDKKMSDFMNEMKNDMNQYGINRVSDRKQSLEIQKKLTDSIEKLSNCNLEKDKQIDVLIVAQKEMMAEKINEKYKNYLHMKGIPEDEYDEFMSLHSAYNKLGGNHHGDAKYEYCMNNLKVIPVETRIKTINKDDNV